MLFRNRTCQLMRQNFKLMQGQYMQKNLTGNHISVLMPLSHMFSENTDMMYNFACEAYKVFVSNGICKQEDFTTNYNQLAHYGAFLSNMMWCYNIKTGKFALYTSSYSILVSLASKGLLMGKRKPIAEEMRTFEEALVSGGRLANSIKKGNTIQAVRLDWEYSGNKLIFKPTIPRSQLVIGEEHIIPYFALDSAMQIINEELQTKILKIVQGDKVRVVTKNPAVLKSIYGETRTNYLLNYTYDARSNSFFVPHVGASIFSNGVTNIDFTAVDSIQVINSVSDIDLSEVKLDIDGACDFCKANLGSLTDDQLVAFMEKLEISGVSDSRELNQQLTVTSLDMLHPYRVYNAMKDLQCFDMDKFKAQPSKWGSSSNVEQLDIPSTMEELTALMKTGIFKVTILTNKGKYAQVVCTNSGKELSRIYGNDYFAKFESYGNKLRALNNELKRSYPVEISEDELEALCNKWGAYDVMADLIDRYPDAYSKGVFAYKQVYHIITLELQGVNDRKTVIKQPNCLTVRSCECPVSGEVTYNYYKNIELHSIKSIVRLTTV